MPLVDHLIELRTRLFRAMIALLVIFVIAFQFGDDLLRIITQPLADVLLSMDNSQERRLIFTDLTESFFTQVKVSFFFAVMVTFPIFASQILVLCRTRPVS